MLRTASFFLSIYAASDKVSYLNKFNKRTISPQEEKLRNNHHRNRTICSLFIFFSIIVFFH